MYAKLIWTSAHVGCELAMVELVISQSRRMYVYFVHLETVAHNNTNTVKYTTLSSYYLLVTMHNIKFVKSARVIIILWRRKTHKWDIMTGHTVTSFGTSGSSPSIWKLSSLFSRNLHSFSYISLSDLKSEQHSHGASDQNPTK